MLPFADDDQQEQTDDDPAQRPLGLVLLTGLYLFFFVMTVSTYGKPLALFGRFFDGPLARGIVFVDSLLCLYLFLGLYKRQLLTWYLLIAYNLVQIINIIANLNFLSVQEIERAIGERVNSEALVVNNLIVALAVLLLTQYIYRHRAFFNNRARYLF